MDEDMKILITGTSGFIGTELLSYLRGRGHEVRRVVRSERQMKEDTVLWDPPHHELIPSDFEGFDVLINLAGENIMGGRWNLEKKRRIKQSRVMGTRLLCELISRLQSPPRLLISASATGFYGNRMDEIVSEDSLPGKGFLAEVCQKWEKATEPAVMKGLKVVKLRIGLVLSLKGGALGKMLIPFKLGLGGTIGSGKQWISWISMDDLMGVFLHIIGHSEIQGAVNAVTPNPVTNMVMTKILGRALRRPTLFSMPTFAMRLIFGEMADEMFLSSTRAIPNILVQTGYSFLYPELEEAFNHMLGKK
jgi:uncharacterized protein (TIGR01777 family)